MSFKKYLKEQLAFLYYNFYHKHTTQIGNRILIYHAIGSKLAHDSYGISITKERFLEHMQFLKEQYTIIALDEHYEDKLDTNTLCITFDDGYKDNLYALEVCQMYGIPFTLYITTGTIGQKDYLNAQDIRLFAKSSICTLGTHGATHTRLAMLSYEKQEDELRKSKQTLEDIIGKKVLHVSYPHGSYNADTIDLIGKIGYNIASSSHIGFNTKENVDLRRLKRIEIIASDDIQNLERKILGYYDYLAFKEKNLTEHKS
ncbi:MAG: polysaccharide deacetylase family protein [Sulfurospirillaceae bacterium]|nr:polysaccharide deacetylase family protein [Sulfurospirillaceae bacterium]